MNSYERKRRICKMIVLVLGILSINNIILTIRNYSYAYFEKNVKTGVKLRITTLDEMPSKSLGDKLLLAETKASNVEEAIKIISDKGDPDFSKAATTNEGMFKTIDDLGDSYYYRGAVTNNNVHFGGYYWKIIRINGDGTIRMIYAGETPNASGDNISINNIKYPYNVNGDATYIGYMYGVNFSEQTTNTSQERGTDAYSFSSSYTYSMDGDFRRYRLSGNIIQATLSEMQSQVSSYPYTILDKNANGSILEIWKITSIETNTSSSSIYPWKVNYQKIKYLSSSYASTLTNDRSSKAKTTLEDWYQSKLENQRDATGKLITDYISDGVFCNDRKIRSGKGYGFSKTYYAGSGRTNLPSLTSCENESDKFSATSNYGNGKLTKPIGLITVDEIRLAGGTSSNNLNYYLYSNSDFWTMSPYYVDIVNNSTYLYGVGSNGNVTSSSNFLGNSKALRPVINLKKDVNILSGDGSVNSPYELKLS